MQRKERDVAFVEQDVFGQGSRRHHDACSCSHTSAPQTTVHGGLYLLGVLQCLENLFSRSLSKPFLNLRVECRLPKWTNLKRQILLTTKNAEVIPCDILHGCLEAS